MLYKRLKNWERTKTLNGMEVMCACNDASKANLAVLVRNFPKGCAGIQDLTQTFRTKSVKERIQLNTSMHLCRLNKGIKDLYGKHKGETAFIVGSSPSIVKHKELLNKLKVKGKSTTIVVNSALDLMRENTEYYFLVDYVSKPDWYRHIEKNIREKVKLITAIQTPIEVLDYFPDYYHFLGYYQGGVNLAFNYMGRLDHAFTATFSAMHFAYLLGVKRIVFVGQDLAYTNNMNHWNEPLTHHWASGWEAKLYKDIYGNAVLSDKRLERNMNCIKAGCIWLKESGIETINATEGGILDIDCMRLEDVLKII